ncbi:MAG: ATP-binding cassette domain-containing protein [Streptosporangiales bacterium]|nr:ATP-binding cassette domain-containing protein [Streptosporangiales bacterium]
MLVAAPLVVLGLFPVIRPYDSYPQAVLLLAFLLAIQAVSWNIISGYAGYISLGHSAYLGIGAYTTGIVGLHTGVNPFIVAPVAGLVAVVTAFVVGIVVLRTRGPAFVIITIAVLLAAQIVALNWSGLTSGSEGITLEMPFWSSDIQNLPFYYFFFVLLLATIAVSAAIRRSRFGAGLVAIREDEGKAAAIGVNTTRYKVLAYCVSTFFIGVAGSGYAYFQTFLNPIGAFNILASVMIVLAALVGGRGTLWGPVIGAFIVQGVNELATVTGGGSNARVLMFGVLLVVVVLFLPAGLLPTIERWWRARHPAEVKYIEQSEALAPTRLEVAASPRTDADAASERPLLEVRGVSKRFGGLSAVADADLTVARGSITAVIGPNGSGKTTLFNLVTGAMRADAGEIWFDGRRIDRLRPWARGHLGLGRTFQTTRLFKEMPVLENVVAPPPDGRWRTMYAGARGGKAVDRARELLAFVGLEGLADDPAGSLSYGQQKLVELVQVLMMEPKLILLDEPAGGVNPSLVARLADIVRDLNQQGVSFLVVEHNIPMVLELCDPVVVFARGAPIAVGPPDTIRNDPAVLDAYLGEDYSAEQGSVRSC